MSEGQLSRARILHLAQESKRELGCIDGERTWRCSAKAVWERARRRRRVRERQGREGRRWKRGQPTNSFLLLASSSFELLLQLTDGLEVSHDCKMFFFLEKGGAEGWGWGWWVKENRADVAQTQLVLASPIRNAKETNGPFLLQNWDRNRIYKSKESISRKQGRNLSRIQNNSKYLLSSTEISNNQLRSSRRRILKNEMIHHSPALDDSLPILRYHNSGDGGIGKGGDLNSLSQREESDGRRREVGEEGFDCWTRSTRGARGISFEL